ncbi:MAG: glycosyltransferase [Candidatus Omnitrophica bacterium]|nr:glycosyltransferase [Candidatus Omnitrophota bacterium]
MPVLSLVVPVYNERETLPVLLTRCAQALAGVDYELVVVEDASTDGTRSWLRERARLSPWLRVIERPARLGLGSAVAEGVAAACGEQIVCLDADLSMPPETIPILRRALETADVAVGSRFMAGGADRRSNRGRAWGVRWGNRLIQRLLRLPVTDLTGGFLALRRSVLHRITLRGLGAEYALLFIIDARRAGCTFAEAPYVFAERAAGRAKVSGSWQAWLRYAGTLGRLVWRERCAAAS